VEKLMKLAKELLFSILYAS